MFKDEYLLLLAKFGIKYDPKYLFECYDSFYGYTLANLQKLLGETIDMLYEECMTSY